MSGWNYRIIRHRDPLPKYLMLKKNKEHREKCYPKGCIEWFALHEVYYNKSGKPNGVTQDPCRLTMDEYTKEEFNRVLKWMRQAQRRPVLDFKTLKEIDAPVKSSGRSDTKNSKRKRV